MWNRQEPFFIMQVIVHVWVGAEDHFISGPVKPGAVCRKNTYTDLGPSIQANDLLCTIMSLGSPLSTIHLKFQLPFLIVVAIRGSDQDILSTHSRKTILMNRGGTFQSLADLMKLIRQHYRNITSCLREPFVPAMLVDR